MGVSVGVGVISAVFVGAAVQPQTKIHNANIITAIRFIKISLSFCFKCNNLCYIQLYGYFTPQAAFCQAMGFFFNIAVLSYVFCQTLQEKFDIATIMYIFHLYSLKKIGLCAIIEELIYLLVH